MDKIASAFSSQKEPILYPQTAEIILSDRALYENGLSFSKQEIKWH